MHIAMVAPHFHPEVGGLETSVRVLATWLARRGHDVTVHTSARTLDGRKLPETDHVDNVSIQRHPLRLSLGYFRSVFDPDLSAAELVHLHGYAVLTNDLAARRSRAPVVYSLLHGVSMPHPTIWTRLERSVYDRVVGVPTLRRVDAIVAANRLDLSWLTARGLQGTKVHLLPSPLPESAFWPGLAERAREQFGSNRFVLFLGRLHREKGVLDLVDALDGIADIEVWFAGPDGGAATQVRDRARAVGVGERVRVLGEVSEDAKRDLLAACEFLVLPSAFEAQGIVVAEAWAQGKPVIATQVGALKEWIETDRTGLLVPPGSVKALRDAIADLLAAPDRIRSMGQLGAAHAEALRLDRVGPQVEALYESLFARGKG